jgi:membrane associated rhomboid family serine protease
MRYPAQKPRHRFSLEAKSLPSSRWLLFFRRFPVTSAVIAAAVAMQVAVWVFPFVHPDGDRVARRRLGAVTELVIILKKSSEQIPQLVGPFDLWEGELWRVPISGFHHVNMGHKANPLHLIMNCLAIAFMGGILEPRMGHWRYAVFFLTATIISMVPEYLLSKYGFGLSGGAYALFGLILVLMQREESVSDRLPPSFVSTGFIWLFLCMAATYFDVIAIGNAAHVTGLIYGWFVGQAFYVPRRLSGLCKIALLAGHLLLIPAGYFLMNPIWLGTYHWYQANYETDTARKVFHLEQSIQRGPSLRIPWSSLAIHYARTGETQRGWQTILRGLDYNRSDDGGVKTARAIWLSFRTPDERWKALQTLESLFGENNRDWLYRLGILPNKRFETGLPISLDLGLPAPGEYTLNNEAERELIRLFSSSRTENHDLTAPQIDPFRIDSAAEGVSL